MSKFTWGGTTYSFDEKLKRNPSDRAAVDKLRQYAEARGGTVREYDYDERMTVFEPFTANFVFAWEGEFVSRFFCVRSTTLPEYLNSLENLWRVFVKNCAGDLSWLGKLSGLREIVIDPAPPDADLFPASWACAPSLEFLVLYYQNGSTSAVPESIQNLRKLRTIRIVNQGDNAVTLPEWLGDLPNLSQSWLRGRFASIPHSVARTGLPFRSHWGASKGIILDNVTLNEGDVSLYLSNKRELISLFFAEPVYGLADFNVRTQI